MRGASLRIPAIARGAGYVAVAIAIGATALHFRQCHTAAATRLSVRTAARDPLALELARCREIGVAAKDDAACEAAWAENRRRFFTYHPADTGAQSSSQQPAEPEGR